jgi:hypothetical protein
MSFDLTWEGAWQCGDGQWINYSTGIISVVSDFYAIALPLAILENTELHISWKQRWTTYLFFCLGIRYVMKDSTSRQSRADREKCRRCWHRKDLLAGPARKPSRHFLDWRESSHMVHCRDAVGNHMCLRSCCPDDICDGTKVLDQQPQLQPPTPTEP